MGKDESIGCRIEWAGGGDEDRMVKGAHGPSLPKWRHRPEDVTLSSFSSDENKQGNIVNSVSMNQSNENGRNSSTLGKLIKVGDVNPSLGL